MRDVIIMGKFIDEVAKINQNNNHKLKISEERDNVKNTLYKRVYKEFSNCDNADDTYDVLANIKTKNKICYEENHFGPRITMEFVDTTYYRELKKAYKIYKEHEKALTRQEEKQDISSLYLVCDDKGKMKFAETIDRHVKNNIPYDIEKTTEYNIKHYHIYDTNKKLYDLKVYCFKDTDAISYMPTYKDAFNDGLFEGIETEKLSPFNPLNILVAIPIIVLMLYLGFHALIGILLILFVVLIILCS